MRTKIIVFFAYLSFTLLLGSCASTMQSFGIDKRLREVELNMTKKTVIEKLGKHYSIEHKSVDPENRAIEIITFESGDVNFYYVLTFENGLLKVIDRIQTLSKYREVREVEID